MKQAVIQKRFVTNPSADDIIPVMLSGDVGHYEGQPSTKLTPETLKRV